MKHKVLPANNTLQGPRDKGKANRCKKSNKLSLEGYELAWALQDGCFEEAGIWNAAGQIPGRLGTWLVLYVSGKQNLNNLINTNWASHY